MFFGPFLPIVPIMVLLEYLPHNIGEPIQSIVLDMAYQVVEFFFP